MDKKSYLLIDADILPPVFTGVIRAKELLAKSAMPVSEIAASVGYDDSRYFARIFAGQVGVPPRKCRAERQMERK